MKFSMVFLALVMLGIALVTAFPVEAKGGGADEAAYYYYQVKSDFEARIAKSRAQMHDIVSEVTSDPVLLRGIIAKIEERIQNLRKARDVYASFVEKARSGQYMIVVVDEHFETVRNDDYLLEANNPKKYGNHLLVEARTNYFKAEGAKLTAQIDEIIDEYVRWRSYFINRLSSQGSPPSGTQPAGQTIESAVVAPSSSQPGASSGGSSNLGGLEGDWEVVDTHTDGCGKQYTYTVTFSGTPSDVKAVFDCYGRHEFNGSLSGNACTLRFSWPGGTGDGTVTFSGSTMSGSFKDSLNHTCTWTGKRK